MPTWLVANFRQGTWVPPLTGPHLVPAKAQLGCCDHDTGPMDFALDA